MCVCVCVLFATLFAFFLLFFCGERTDEELGKRLRVMKTDIYIDTGANPRKLTKQPDGHLLGHVPETNLKQSGSSVLGLRPPELIYFDIYHYFGAWGWEECSP